MNAYHKWFRDKYLVLYTCICILFIHAVPRFRINNYNILLPRRNGENEDNWRGWKEEWML